MSVEFEKHAVRPDSAEYVYDKRVNFEQPVESSDWDED
jgi:hypothetical protein